MRQRSLCGYQGTQRFSSVLALPRMPLAGSGWGGKLPPWLSVHFSLFRPLAALSLIYPLGHVLCILRCVLYCKRCRGADPRLMVNYCLPWLFHVFCFRFCPFFVFLILVCLAPSIFKGLFIRHCLGWKLKMFCRVLPNVSFCHTLTIYSVERGLS